MAEPSEPRVPLPLGLSEASSQELTNALSYALRNDERSKPRRTGGEMVGIRGASFGLRKSLDTVGGFLGPLLAMLVLLLMAGDIVTVFWLATIPAALAMAVLILGVREPLGDCSVQRFEFRLSQALRLNSAVRSRQRLCNASTGCLASIKR